MMTIKTEECYSAEDLMNSSPSCCNQRFNYSSPSAASFCLPHV